MCYNANVSFGTFAFVALVSSFLWLRNRDIDKAIALMLLVVAFMQLIEGALWLHPECDETRKQLSSSIPLVLYLQPLLLNAIVFLFAAGWGVGYRVLAIGFLCFLPFQLAIIRSHYGSCVEPDAQGHLNWTPVGATTDSAPLGILPMILYDLAMVYPFVTLKRPLFGLAYAGASIASRIKLGERNPATWPSLWCHFVNLLAVFALV